MRPLRFAKPALTLAALAGLALGGYLTREAWLPWLQHGQTADPTAEAAGAAAAPSEKVIVSDQAQRNLGLTAARLLAQTAWKSIQVPGMVVDRPARSDRGVVAPASGVVGKIAFVPGDTVRSGEVLFRLRLLSDPLHQAQTDLFKTTQDLALVQAQRKRLLSNSSTPEVRIIEAGNQITRLQVAAKAYRQELLNRGLTPGQVDRVAEGTFVSEITIAAPSPPAGSRPLTAVPVTQSEAEQAAAPTFEVQELKVELGQQVQAGQTLCLLANHQELAIEGRAFRDETPLLERSVRKRWPVEVDFREDAGAARPAAQQGALAPGAEEEGWPALGQTFRIGRLANTIDPVNRTFAFLIPLENQSRVVQHDGRAQMLWRFRPGQKVRVKVRVERLDNVFVLPPDAVAREGPEAYVFTQNVNTFERKPVRVLLQERDRVVIANDGSLPTYSRDKEALSAAAPREKEVWTIPAVALAAAAQLNRMVKAGSAGVPKGYHIHADGSLHKNEDEGK